jgi:hypothetical protein
LHPYDSAIISRVNERRSYCTNQLRITATTWTSDDYPKIADCPDLKNQELPGADFLHWDEAQQKAYKKEDMIIPPSLVPSPIIPLRWIKKCAIR